MAFDTGFAGIFVEADGALPYTLVDVQVDKVAGSVEAATETVSRADRAGFAVGIAEQTSPGRQISVLTFRTAVTAHCCSVNQVVRH